MKLGCHQIFAKSRLRKRPKLVLKSNQNRRVLLRETTDFRSQKGDRPCGFGVGVGVEDEEARLGADGPEGRRQAAGGDAGRPRHGQPHQAVQVVHHFGHEPLRQAHKLRKIPSPTRAQHFKPPQTTPVPRNKSIKLDQTRSNSVQLGTTRYN